MWFILKSSLIVHLTDSSEELVSKETHIDDILFGSGGALDKLEVLYGEPGGVSMLSLIHI